MTQINLLPWRDRQRHQAKQQFQKKLLAAVFLVLMALILIHQCLLQLENAQIRRCKVLQKETAFYNKQVMEIKKLDFLKNTVISRITILQTLETERPLLVHLVDELVRIVPEGIYLSKLTRKKNEIRIQGYSNSNSLISLLMRNIENNPWLQEPLLTEIRKNNELQTLLKRHHSETQYEFKLSFKLKAIKKLAVEL